MWVEPTYLHQGEVVNESELADTGVKRKYPPQIRIEQIKELTQFLGCSPLIAQSKVAIITDAHCMAIAAANALLKTLEEPKIGTIILISSQPQKLLPTIASRCQVIPFHRLNHLEMVAVLEKLERQEVLSNLTVMSKAGGSPGQAIAHYNQLQSIPHDLLTKLSQFPTSALTAMQIAKEIDEQLEYYQQLWLQDYLQHNWWHRYHNAALVEKVESAKAALSKMANSRLVWEVLLMPSASYRIDGAVEPKAHKLGDSAQLKPEQEAVIATLMEEDNDAFLVELCDRLEQRVGVRVSQTTMERIVQKLKLTRGKLSVCNGGQPSI